MEIVIRATVIFFFLWFLTRATGKRTLSQLSAFELILMVTIGDLVQQGVTQEDMSLTGSMLAVGTIGLLISLTSWVSFRFAASRTRVEGLPVVVIRDGRIIDEALRLERLDMQDLLEGARESGIGDLREVQFAVLEPDGRLSFVKSDGGAGDGETGAVAS